MSCATNEFSVISIFLFSSCFCLARFETKGNFLNWIHACLDSLLEHSNMLERKLPILRASENRPQSPCKGAPTSHASNISEASTVQRFFPCIEERTRKQFSSIHPHCNFSRCLCWQFSLEDMNNISLYTLPFIPIFPNA